MNLEAGRRSVTIGIFSILLSAVLFAPLSQTATKYLASQFPLIQILFFRALGQTLWTLLFFLPGNGLGMFRANKPKLQLARSAVLFVSGMFWVVAVTTLPLTTASAIAFTAPMMVVIMSVPFLGERVGVHRWTAVVVGFIGALVVIRPGSGEIAPEIGWMLIAAFLFAIYQILTRKVASQDSEATTSIYTVIVALVVTAVMIPWHFVAPEPGDWAVYAAFVGMGLLGGARHLLVVKAYASAPASLISPFFYCELVGVTILGYAVFDDIPDIWTIIGALIIVLGGLYITQRERVVAKRKSSSNAC